MKDLYDKYFKGKKAADDVEKATFAYHWDTTDHPNGHKWPSGHYDHKANPLKPMPNHIRFEKCHVCGRTRNDVRWDNLPAHCDNVGRPTISDVLLREEADFIEMLESSAEKIPAILKKRFKGELTAEALFFLQSSTGYPPDVVALHYDEQKIEALMPEFDRLMEEHQKKSGKFKGVK